MKTELVCRRAFWHYLRPTTVLRCRRCASVVATVTLSVLWIGFFVVLISSQSSPRRQLQEPRRDDSSYDVGRRFVHEVDATTRRRDLREPITPPRSTTPHIHPSQTVIQADEPCRPAEILRLRRSNVDGRWFNFTHDSFSQFYAYSAMWDDRSALVRVLAIANSVTSGVMRRDPVPLEFGVHCRFHLPDGRWLGPVSVLPLALPIGYGWWLNEQLVREFVFECRPPTVDIRPDGVTMLVGRPVNSTVVADRPPTVDIRPDGVTMLVGRPVNSTVVVDPRRTSCVPVEYPEKPTVKADFAVCVQVTYGSLDPLQLIEWMELQRMFGVQMVGVYNMSIDEGPAAQVLRYYSTHGGLSEDRGFVELRRSDYIAAEGTEQFLLHGSPVINDCMYRNMYRFKHIIVVDYDEFIVPQPPRLTLHDVIKELELLYSARGYPPINYIFANSYFFTDFMRPPTPGPTLASAQTTPSSTTVFDEIASRLITLRFRRRAPLSKYGYAVKSIIDPLACQQMHNHYCWEVTEAYKSRGYTEVVSDKLAVNQHYKSCHLNATECARAFYKATVDEDTMKPHRDKLVDNVVKRIREIFALSPAEFLRKFT